MSHVLTLSNSGLETEKAFNMNLWGHSYSKPHSARDAILSFLLVKLFVFTDLLLIPHNFLPLQNILAPPMSSIKVFFCSANQSFQPIWPTLVASISAKANVTLGSPPPAPRGFFLLILFHSEKWKWAQKCSDLQTLIYLEQHQSGKYQTQRSFCSFGMAEFLFSLSTINGFYNPQITKQWNTIYGTSEIKPSTSWLEDVLKISQFHSLHWFFSIFWLYFYYKHVLILKLEKKAFIKKIY